MATNRIETLDPALIRPGIDLLYHIYTTHKIMTLKSDCLFRWLSSDVFYAYTCIIFSSFKWVNYMHARTRV